MANKLLLVDADPSLLEKLGRRLEKAGFDVKTASDGTGALEEAVVGKPDLLITNYHLPIFSGERLRAFLRNNPTTFHIPLIFLVDNANEKDSTLASIGPDPFLVKPFRWDDISAKITEALEGPGGQTSAMGEVGSGVEGSLKEVSLVDLLQIFSLNRRTGVMTLNHDGAEGNVYLKNGEVISAVLGETKGEKALYRILRWHEGTFHYQPIESTVSRNIARPVDALLMEGMRQLDEWDSLQGQMPPVSAVLKLNKSQDEMPRDLRPVTKEVVLLLEFFNTVGDIIEKSSFTDYEISKSILGLIQKGILTPIQERRSVTRDETPLVTADQALLIRKTLGLEEGASGDLGWGRILLFASSPDLIKSFLADAGSLDEFQLSRDNFSNQEVLNASFGTLGSLEISDKTRLQLFVLPSGDLFRPLWKPFSEGSVGAVLLTHGDETDGKDLTLVSEFVNQTLNHPLVHWQIEIEGEDRVSASEVFQSLFAILLKEANKQETRPS